MNKPKMNSPGAEMWKRLELVEWQVDAPMRVEVRRHREYDDWFRFGKPHKLADKVLIILASDSNLT